MKANYHARELTLTSGDPREIELLWWVLEDMSNCVNYTDEDAQRMRDMATTIKAALQSPEYEAHAKEVGL